VVATGCFLLAIVLGWQTNRAMDKAKQIGEFEDKKSGIPAMAFRFFSSEKGGIGVLFHF